MAGTPRTISTLLNEVQDLVLTLKVRTGGGTVNIVTAPEYGADPTGTADSTAAFAAALAGPAVAIVPPGVYRISNLVIPTGASLIGYDAIAYSYNSGDSNSTVIVALNSSTQRIINIDNRTNISIFGLQIDCDYTRTGTRSTSCDGISAGGRMITLRDVTVRFARYGIGGAVASGTNKTNNGQIVIQNCQLFNCNIGIGDLADAWISNSYMSYCQYGAWFTAASGSVNIVGSRVEWNTADGIHVEGMSDLIVSATMFDRNYVSAVYLQAGYKILFSGCEFKRNGRNLDSNSCHVRFNSSSTVTFSGCSSRNGQDDDGTGNDAPTVWARELGTSGNIIFVGNDLLGISGTTPMTLAQFWVGNLPNNYVFSSNNGTLMDERSGGRPSIVSGFVYNQLSSVNINQNSSSNVLLYHDPISTYSGLTHKLRVTARNQSNGNMYSAEFNYLIHREGGTPTITQSSAFGTIGTSGYIGFGSGTIQLSWTSISADASTYTLAILNSSSSDINYVTAQIM